MKIVQILIIFTVVINISFAITFTKDGEPTWPPPNSDYIAIGVTIAGECDIYGCDDDNYACDAVVTCAMTKEKNRLEARLDDLIDTIKENTEQTKHQTKIIKQELDHYVALLARVKKENEILSKAAFLSKKIRDSESLGVQINAIGRRKE